MFIRYTPQKVGIENENHLRKHLGKTCSLYDERQTAFKGDQTLYGNHSSASDSSVISDNSFKMTIQIIKYPLGLLKDCNDLLSTR